jgi:hypothetical protein
MTIATITRYRSGRGSRPSVNGYSTNASGGEILVADPGAGYKIVIDFISITCAAADSVSIREDTTVIIGPIAFLAAGQTHWERQFENKDTREGGLILTANTELQVLTAGSVTVHVYCEYHIIKEA